MLQRLYPHAHQGIFADASRSADAGGYFRHAGDPDDHHGLCPDHRCHRYPPGGAGHGQDPGLKRTDQRLYRRQLFSHHHQLWSPRTRSPPSWIAAQVRAVISRSRQDSAKISSPGAQPRYSSLPTVPTATAPPSFSAMPGISSVITTTRNAHETAGKKGILTPPTTDRDREPSLVQRQPGEQILLCPLADCHHALYLQPAADQYRHRPGKGDRHHRAGHGHPDPGNRIYPRQDHSLHDHRLYLNVGHAHCRLL